MPAKKKVIHKSSDGSSEESSDESFPESPEFRPKIKKCEVAHRIQQERGCKPDLGPLEPVSFKLPSDSVFCGYAFITPNQLLEACGGDLKISRKFKHCPVFDERGYAEMNGLLNSSEMAALMEKEFPYSDCFEIRKSKTGYGVFAKVDVCGIINNIIFPYGGVLTEAFRLWRSKQNGIDKIPSDRVCYINFYVGENSKKVTRIVYSPTTPKYGEIGFIQIHFTAFGWNDLYGLKGVAGRNFGGFCNHQCKKPPHYQLCLYRLEIPYRSGVCVLHLPGVLCNVQMIKKDEEIFVNYGT